jgi:hypothetical protein
MQNKLFPAQQQNGFISVQEAGRCIRDEIDFVCNLIEKIMDNGGRNIARIILSRTMRSYRATRHADLATIYEPVTALYYCSKYGKICKPIFSIIKWWESYSKNTVKRLIEFNSLRTQTYQICLSGNSRNINLTERLRGNPDFHSMPLKNEIAGILSSPPYIGLIGYHGQHAYAYDIFGFIRNDNFEIGNLFKGKGKVSCDGYIEGISAVLKNAKAYLVDNYNVFLVANDKFNMYPIIAQNAGIKIVNQYHSTVLDRTEKGKSAYSEIIFHMRNN